MKRVITISLCLSLLLTFCLVSPVSADVLDPKDYEYKFKVVDDQAYLNVEFPTDMTEWIRYFNGEVYSSGRGSILKGTWPLRQFDNLDVRCWPLGTYNELDISEFPLNFTVDTNCELSFTFDETMNEAMTVNVLCHLATYETVGDNLLSTFYKTVNVSTFTVGPQLAEQEYFQRIDVSESIERGENGDYFGIFYEIQFDGIDDEESTVRCNYEFINYQTFLSFSVSDLYYENQQNQEQNELLRDVNDKLEDMGTTMDEVLEAEQSNGEKLDMLIDGYEQDPVSPDGSDDITDYLDKEDEILDDAISGWEDSELVLDSFDNSVTAFGPALMAVSTLIEGFIALPAFSNIIMFGFGLGILSVILNMGLEVQSYFKRKKDKANMQKKGRGK